MRVVLVVRVLGAGFSGEEVFVVLRVGMSACADCDPFPLKTLPNFSFIAPIT